LNKYPIAFNEKEWGIGQVLKEVASVDFRERFICERQVMGIGNQVHLLKRLNVNVNVVGKWEMTTSYVEL
jgi:hypothetical protein